MMRRLKGKDMMQKEKKRKRIGLMKLRYMRDLMRKRIRLIFLRR